MMRSFSTTPTPTPARRSSPPTTAAAEAGEAVPALHEGLRMLGGPAADQRAAGHLAALGDALHHVGGDADVELLAHVAVEKEQRPPAPHQHLAAARGDALHPVGGDAYVELLAHVVVEKEQRLRALAQHVVGAHGDQVDADGGV